MPEIKRDTARFDNRQFYVDGYAMHWFSTKDDAEAALSLANQVAENEKREVCNAIREALPR